MRLDWIPRPRLSHSKEDERKTVAICGSLQYRQDMEAAAQAWMRSGHHVTIPQPHNIDSITLMRLNFQRIDRADMVLVVNPNGQITRGTVAQIAYALHHGKPVHYTHNPA